MLFPQVSQCCVPSGFSVAIAYFALTVRQPCVTQACTGSRQPSREMSLGNPLCTDEQSEARTDRTHVPGEAALIHSPVVAPSQQRGEEP